MSFEKPTLFCVSCFSGHHLTTSHFRSASQPEFYVSTFFYSRKHQRRNLCNSHKFPRWFIVFSRMSQFSDPKGRRFESCQPHQKMSLYCRTTTFLFWPGAFCHPASSYSAWPLCGLRPHIGHVRSQCRKADGAAGRQSPDLAVWKGTGCPAKAVSPASPIRQTRHPAKPHGFVRCRVLL